MYVNPSIGRIILSRAIGSVFFIATAVVISIVKEELDARREKRMGGNSVSARSVCGKSQCCHQRRMGGKCPNYQRNNG